MQKPVLKTMSKTRTLKDEHTQVLLFEKLVELQETELDELENTVLEQENARKRLENLLKKKTKLLSEKDKTIERKNRVNSNLQEKLEKLRGEFKKIQN